MSGIASIVKERRENPDFEGEARRELWLKDGDNAFVTFVVKGDDDKDNRLSTFFMKSYQQINDSGQKSWRNCVCDVPLEDGSCGGYCPDDFTVRKEFGIWAYVHQIHHDFQNPSKDTDAIAWKEKVNATGGVKYVESIDDFRVFRRGFGRNGSFFDQLVDIYNEIEDLRTKIVKINRKGEKLSTVYSMTLTTSDSPVTEESWKQATELDDIPEYMSKHYGCNKLKSGGQNQSPTSEIKVSSPPVNLDSSDEASGDISSDEIKSLFEGGDDDNSLF